jgi:predicted permease
MLHDLRFGLRMLAKAPGFTAVAVLSLAFGIGANTAIFTLIDAVLLRTLPVHEPEELVLLRWSSVSQYPIGVRWLNGNNWEERGRHLSTSISYPAFQQIRAGATGSGRAFSDVLAFAVAGNPNVLTNGEGGNAFTQMVSGNYFSMLGIRPAIGRTLVESDDQPGAAPVCVVSDRFWSRRFGSDRSIAGKAVAINGIPFTIVGVTPPEFFGLQPGLAIDVSVPLALQRIVAPRWDPLVSLFTAPDHWWLATMGRLNPGVSARQASASAVTLFQRSIDPSLSFTEERPPVASLEAAPGGQGLDQLRRQYSRPLWILMGMVGLVLLIACANVANLQLARAASRQREIGVRLSLGAPRSRLIRQLLTESILLSSIGGALGFGMAWWGSRLLVRFLSYADSPIPLNLQPDFRVLAFTAAACLVTGLLFGLAPAFRATRADLTPALKRDTPHAGAGVLRLGLAKGLMIGQVAFSLVLLFGAGLFVRTLVNLESLNVGFDQQNVLLFGVNGAGAGYRGAALNDFYDRVQERVAGLPGVVSATASYHLLLSGSSMDVGLWVPGFVPKTPERMHVRAFVAAPNFFQTMKIPLLRGRDFTGRDDLNAPKVVVVNEAFVKQYFADRDPIGRRIAWDRTMPEMEIVGVVKDAKYYSLRNEAPSTIYLSFRQQQNSSWMHFEVRTAADPRALIPDVRRLLASLDRSAAVFDVKTQTDQIDELLLQERLFAKLTSFFGLLALALASVGLYGILSYAVARRTGELGIRMALGAQRRNIVSMILRETMLVVAAGLALGIPAALAAGRLASGVISDLLYGLKAGDVSTVAIAAAALLAVAAVAGFLPARRASSIDPMVAVRSE